MFARICTSPSMCCRLKHLDSQVDPKDSIRSNNRGRDIDSKNQKGYSVVKELAGHGIGYKLHEDPFILGYGKKKTGLKLVKNMTIAIESMINMGKSDITEEADGWTIRSKDHSISGHFEHTLLVTDSKPEILTLL